MSTSDNKYDTIEQMIYADNVRIASVRFMVDFDLMLIKLSTGAILSRKISQYSGFQNAGENQLNNYQLISLETGIHWPELDEDLSLKGFLSDELKRFITTPGEPVIL